MKLSWTISKKIYHAFMQKSDLSKDGVLRTIFPLISNKYVLDVGCVEHSLDRKNKNRIWVHDFLKKNTLSTTGIDIVQKDVDLLKEQGYDVSCQNAETFHFKQKFDVIFAGELIEHLSNPGLFLERSYKHLKDDGILILTTPNCFSFQRFVDILTKLTNNPVANTEHTCWFSPQVLMQLLKRNRFNPDKFVFVNYPIIHPSRKLKFIHFFTRFFVKFSETMIVVCKK